jgi:2-polyprenyl-3-methyl-5-hydroxy-6-metoxy-1,4-benzoquinol methylase
MTDYRERVYRYYVSTRRHVDRLENLDGFDSPYMKKLIREHFPPDRDAPIVDLGCGWGILVYLARRAGYCNVIGVDRSPEQVAESRRLGIEGIVQGDAMGTLRSLADGSQQVVLALDVIEHLDKHELLQLVDEIRRVLKPGGTWIIHTPNAMSPFFGAIRYGDFTHEQAFTPVSINQLLRASGFQSVECFEDAPIPHGLRSFARWLVWKLARNLLRVYLAAETGTGGGRDAVFSQNFLIVATK